MAIYVAILVCLRVGISTQSGHHLCRLTGRVGVKLANGSTAFSSEELKAGLACPKAATYARSRDQSAAIDTVSAKLGGQAPGLLQSRIQPQTPSTSSSPGNWAPLASAHHASELPAAKVYFSKSQTTAAFLAESRLPLNQPVVCGQPPVPYVSCEVQNEDDALEALQELDALLTSTPVSRPKAANQDAESYPQRATMKYQSSPSARSSAASAHTSTADSHHRRESGSLSHRSLSSLSTVTEHMAPHSTVPHSTVRRLWTEGRDEQPKPGPSSPFPMRILKRPSIASGQSSPDAVSPPLATQADQTLPARANTSVQPIHVVTGASSTPGGPPPGLSRAALCDSMVSISQTSNSLSNERLKSKSVLQYLQRQQQVQSSTSPVSSESSKGSKLEAPACSHSSSPSLSVAAAAAAVESSHVVPLQFPSEGTVSNVSAPVSVAYQATSNMPQRSSSPVDDLVLELQLQHLVTRVPGLLPAMAAFTIKVSLCTCMCTAL